MTKHERTFVASPSLDMAKTAKALNPKWDVAQIATRGHVLTARMSRLTKLGLLPALALGVFATWGVMKASVNVGYIEPPRIFAEALSYDPNTYFDLGGGLRGPVALAWMGDYRPTPESLSQAEYDALVAALREDLGNHGANPSNWSALAGVTPAPKITSPARLFSEFSDRLKDGAVVIDQEHQGVYVVAYVGGQWALTMFRGRACGTFIGPMAAGCEDHILKYGWTGDILAVLASFKPTAKE